ncbi:MAG: flagellar motor switch phosphatase FliY [Clostridiaceae bacterium]|nr:flagellar motor switch phosphatase FliY [Clostridiaceae bacterium]
MGDLLSQAEIDALLRGSAEEVNDSSNASYDTTESLNEQEKDALGEIGNISMGTSATTLYALLGQKVYITTPRVQETTWDELAKMFVTPYVAVKIQYTEGLKGCNLLIIKEEDVKIITDLMMGGDGFSSIQAELSELHLSAISEAMNQMVGSAATSLSSMFDKRVDISPPESSLIDIGSGMDSIRLDQSSKVVVVQFSLKVGDLIDSEIMQIMPLNFSKELVANLLNKNMSSSSTVSEPSATQPQENYNAGVNLHQTQYTVPPQPQPQHHQPMQNMHSPMQNNPEMGGYPNMYGYQQEPRQAQFSQNPVNVQPVQFQPFDDVLSSIDRNNINLLMDVPLQITVELGRTNKKIREILEFGQGSIIELDKLAGEPVDILVNGKTIAKGEVVVIDESFGVRITDIIHPSKRI